MSIESDPVEDQEMLEPVTKLYRAEDDGQQIESDNPSNSNLIIKQTTAQPPVSSFTLLRPGTLSRVIKSDPETKTVSKKAVEFMNHATVILARTLAKSCVVAAARSGKDSKKQRLESDQLKSVCESYVQLEFLAESFLDIGLGQQTLNFEEVRE